jgi:putative flippase GtrA
VFKAFYQKHRKNLGHFLKFQAVSVINFIVDYGAFFVLTAMLGMMTALANVISYTLGIINSFLWNRYWTFRIRHSFISVHFLKFIFVNLISLGVNTLAVWILVELYHFNVGLFGLENFFAKLVATVFSFTVNFAGNKLVVFYDGSEQSCDTQDGGV